MVVKQTAIQEVKKKKKIWVPILASKEFNSQELGETFVEDPQQCMGRVVSVNLMMLTKDPKKQNFNVKFKVNEIKNNQALTELVSYIIQVAQFKRTTKKGKNKVDDSSRYKTKDNVDIVIKPIFLTKSLTYKTTLKLIRKNSRELLDKYTKNSTYSQIMVDIISNNLQRDLKNGIKKTYPVINCIIKEASKLS